MLDNVHLKAYTIIWGSLRIKSTVSFSKKMIPLDTTLLTESVNAANNLWPAKISDLDSSFFKVDITTLLKPANYFQDIFWICHFWLTILVWDLSRKNLRNVRWRKILLSISIINSVRTFWHQNTVLKLSKTTNSLRGFRSIVASLEKG